MRLPPTQRELSDIAARLFVPGSVVTFDEAHMLYLFGPTRVRVNGDVRVIRTSLDAALGDTRGAVNRLGNGMRGTPDRSTSWLGASGYMMLLDQLGTVFDYGSSCPKWSGRDFRGLLISVVAGLPDGEAAALYALRCAFIHSYGLVNEPPAKLSEAERTLLRHVFDLNVGTASLVTFDDRTDVLLKPLPQLPRTVVDLGRLGDLVESIVDELRVSFLRGDQLPWRVNDMTEFVGLSFFGHPDDSSPTP